MAAAEALMKAAEDIEITQLFQFFAVSHTTTNTSLVFPELPFSIAARFIFMFATVIVKQSTLARSLK